MDKKICVRSNKFYASTFFLNRFGLDFCFIVIYFVWNKIILYLFYYVFQYIYMIPKLYLKNLLFRNKLAANE